MADHRLLHVNSAAVLAPRLVVDAVGGADEVTLVELTATDETVVRRLTGRETGSGLQEQLGRSRRLAGVLARGATPGTLQVVTDGRSVTEVAAEVVRLSGWTGGSAPSA